MATSYHTTTIFRRTFLRLLIEWWEEEPSGFRGSAAVWNDLGAWRNWPPGASHQTGGCCRSSVPGRPVRRQRQQCPPPVGNGI
ncbi:MAG: hypothetical protein R2830_15240 [Saprospiraceae bacterium]